jgi:hypothetical protein
MSHGNRDACSRQEDRRHRVRTPPPNSLLSLDECHTYTLIKCYYELILLVQVWLPSQHHVLPLSDQFLFSHFNTFEHVNPVPVVQIQSKVPLGLHMVCMACQSKFRIQCNSGFGSTSWVSVLSIIGSNPVGWSDSRRWSVIYSSRTLNRADGGIRS